MAAGIVAAGASVASAAPAAPAPSEGGKAYGGNPRRRREGDFGRVFTGLLFALFVVTLLAAILVGTNVYRALHQEGEAADNQRLSLTLLANDVRANDQIDAVARAWVTEDAVAVEMAEAVGPDGSASLAAVEQEREGSLLQGPALVLRETLPSGVFETRLYRYDGTIMEEYALADAPYDPEKAVAIVKSDTFDFAYEDGLLTIATDAGEVSVALRSGGGER